MKTVYSGNLPMRIAVMFSGGASSVVGLMGSKNHGRLYEVVGGVTDKPGCGGHEILEERDVPVIPRPWDPKTYKSKPHYYEQAARDLEEFNPDVVLLSGFMRIVEGAVLDEYGDRIFNVHPADLAILEGLGVERAYVGAFGPKLVARLFNARGFERKFKGLKSVHDAIKAGEPYTKSTVHFATLDVDEGPIVVQSREFPVELDIRTANEDEIEAYADSLQEQMKWEGDGPAVCKTMEFAATKRLGVDLSEGAAYLDGNPLPYSGFQLGD